MTVGLASRGSASPRQPAFDGHSARAVALLLAGYVVLWVFEGAFRKWVPGTNLIFYVARDVYAVVALVCLASMRRAEVRRVPWWVLGALGLLGLWLGLQFVQPDAPTSTVLLFGLRTYVAPFLFAILCFKYGNLRALDRCWAALAVTVPVELAITVLQVLSPPDAFLNLQVGGAPNAFVNGGEVVRATGTFTAPLGFTVYLLLALVVALSWTVRPERRVLGWVLVAGVLGTVALSGSRGAVLNSALLVVVYLLYSLAQGTWRSGRRVIALCVLLTAALIAVQLVLPDVLQAFLTRFDDASADEDSSTRIIGWFADYLSQSPTLVGEGMGARSNAGIALGSSAVWIENDSLRWVSELGLLGYLLALVRSVAAVALTVVGIVGLQRDSARLTLLRFAVVILLTFGAVNETPMNEGGFGILLGSLVLCTISRTEGPRALRRPGDDVKAMR